MTHEEIGKQQGATTGRWEIAANIGKPEKQWKRWTDVPMWYRVLDRFGLPTLFALVVLSMLWQMWGQVREDWTAQREAMVGAMQQQTQAIKELVNEVRQNTLQDHERRAIDRAREAR